MNTAPSFETMRSMIGMACRAPSVHNSQPWRWLLAEHSLHLYIDRSRLLPVLDPTGRELVISCGAALHHARVVFAASGWRVSVHRLPNPAQPDHLAALEFQQLFEVDTEAVALAAAAAERWTDRRPFLPDPVPDKVLTALAEVARDEDASLVLALDDTSRGELVDAVAYAGSVQRDLPEYRRELAEWTGRHTGDQGVPIWNVPSGSERGTVGRDFTLVGAGELPVPVLDDGAVLAVLATPGDSYESWLHAGEALSAVLINAARLGLATCTLSQVGEVAASRVSVRRSVLGDTAEPQLAVRIGWPVTHEFPAPLSPRRPVSETIEQFRSV
jgi:hypothetical protein